MKVYTKIILDKNNNIIHEESYDYEGGWSYLGIHFDYKSTRGAKAMEKKEKREKKLAERKAKRQSKQGFSKDEQNKSIPLDHVITLEDITNPDKK